jgi:hypothetical protein
LTSGRKLDLRVALDRAELSDHLRAQRIRLEPDAISFAASKLNESWLTAWASSVFSIQTSKTGTSGVFLSTWADTVRAIFEMRDLAGIEEQIRRLNIPSHEALDTDLVLRVAGRYHRSGFNIVFEANGKGCSDLLIEGHGFRSYAEVKRENLLDHKHQANVKRASLAFLAGAEPEIRSWLEDRELRMELKFSRSFSPSIVSTVIEELRSHLYTVGVLNEQPLNSVPGSRYIVLPCQSAPFFRKGMHTGHIIVKEPGTPVPVAPQNMPILVVFDWLPNLKALKKRLKKASMQMRGDASMDPGAQGFIVLEMSHGELAKDAIVEHFSLLPTNCLGVVLLSDSSYLVPRSDLSAESAKALMVAGTPMIQT